MKLAVFSAKPYDKKYMEVAVEEATKPTSASAFAPSSSSSSSSSSPLELVFHDFPLSAETVPLAAGATAISVFVNDTLSADVLTSLHRLGVRAVLLRCAGYNNVDLARAEALGLFVANVPGYSPEAVAEFAVALVQTLNRHTHRAYNRVREGNFALDGLLGRTLRGKTVGVVGTGRIGVAFARIMAGFGCELLAYDVHESDEFRAAGGAYVPLHALLARADVVSLHCPLTDATRHIINRDSLRLMRPGAVLVNTSRGGLVDTRAVVASLKSGALAGLALDVYEHESALFYEDHSGEVIQDDVLMRLMTFPNVIVCGHQAFFTEEALTEISQCTLRNLEDFVRARPCANSLVKEGHVLVRRESYPVRTV